MSSGKEQARRIAVVDYPSAEEFEKIKVADPNNGYGDKSGDWSFETFRGVLAAAQKKSGAIPVQLTLKEIEEYCTKHKLPNNNQTRARLAVEKLAAEELKGSST